MAPDFQLSTQQQRPLPHAYQPNRPGVAQLLGADAAAVVFDPEEQLAGLAAERDLHAGGVGVPLHVGQGLLQDAKHRRRGIVTHRQFIRRHTRAALNFAVVLKVAGLPFHGGAQPQAVQHHGP
jgi:hypothetical protein